MNNNIFMRIRKAAEVEAKNDNYNTVGFAKSQKQLSNTINYR
jgi:hypothetical protein